MSTQLLSPAREVIRASAGSGKTFRISSEIIALLALGEPPDEIFASTFTRKAAGEILDRVLLRLATAALEPVAARELAEHARLLAPGAAADFNCGFWGDVLERTVRRLHRMNVGTLDAFFLRTAACFAHELGLPAQWRIVDEPTSDRLRSYALQDVLRTHDAGVLLPLIRAIVSRPATRSLHDQLLRQLRLLMTVHYALDPAFTDHWDGFDRAAAGADGQQLEAERELLAAAMRELRAPLTRAGTEHERFRKAINAMAAAVEAADWAAFVDLTLVQKAIQREEFSRIAIPEEIVALVDRAWEVARGQVALRMSARSHALGRFAELFARALERRRAEHGAYEFDDITRLLGGPDPLGTRPDLYYRLDARARHILLDEFQDTSVPQWQALEPLLDELLSGYQDERAAVIVADPKQSIYGWRGGTPDLVRLVRERYPLADGELTRSWRSSEVVLSFVNELYGRLGDAATWDDDDYTSVARDWLRDFSPHCAARRLPGHVVVRTGPQDEGRGEARPLLCRYAAEQVAQLHRELPGFSIGVLTRTNATVARMMAELKQLDVCASEEGGNPLTDAASVTAVLALLRLCDHPGHTVAAYHVAHTPLGEAIGYRDCTDRAATLALSAQWRRRLLEDGYGATLAELAARLDHACDPRERRRLAQLVELAFRYEPQATLRPSDFVRFVRHERVEDPVAAPVRVMTVHQAKGLEFDVVVLPELDAPFRQGRPADLLAYRENPGAPVRRAFPYLKRSLRALFPEIEELQRAEEDAFINEVRDGLSTMYVALTRARHALHIIVRPDQGRAKTPARVLLRALVPERDEFRPCELVLERGTADWPCRLATEPKCAAQQSAAPQPPQPAAAAAPAARVVLHRDGRRSRALPRRSPSQLEGGGRVDLGMVLRLSGAAARGSVVHRWFEAIGWREDGVPDDAALAALALEVDGTLRPEAITALIAEFRGWLARPALARLLSRSAWPAGASVECEVPFLTRDGDEIIKGFIDRLVLTRTGGRVSAAAVIDYKTDAVTDARDVEQRTSHYRPQLQAYRRAVAAMYGLAPAAVEAWLVMLEAGEVIPITGTGEEAT